MTGKLGRILAFLLTPLLYANLAGMAAGVVWLIASAQWQVVWIGICALVFSPYLIPVALVPAGICSHFMGQYRRAHRAKAERVMFVCSLSYVLAFIAFWCAGVLAYVLSRTAPDALHPALLWGCATALAPLLMWASRDRANIFITAMVEVGQVAVLLLAALRLCGLDLSFGAMFVCTALLLAAAAAAQAVYEKKTQDRG